MATLTSMGLPLAQMDDDLDPEAEDLARMGALQTVVTFHFSTAAAATTAYGGYVAQGGVLVDGMTRTVGGYPQTYRAGAWRGVMPNIFQTGSFYATTWNGTQEVGVASLSITDPGVTYYLDCSGSLRLSAVSGVQCEAVIRLDALGGTLASPVLTRSGQYPSGELMSLTCPPYLVGPLTGPHSLLMTVQTSHGSGNWEVLAAGNVLRGDITPV